MPFDSDKRLFYRQAPENAKIVDWEQYLTASWQDICQFYAGHFKPKEQAEYYCHNALMGVALLILDDSDKVEHTVQVKVSEAPDLKFAKFGDFLFSISDEDNTNYSTACYNFQPAKIGKNLCLSLQDKPQLIPMQPDEFAANSIFSVYGFSYGGNANQKNAIEQVLIKVTDGKSPLLAEIFTRLITEQWKFKRTDTIAKSIRSGLRPIISEYNNYIIDEINCTTTNNLETHLLTMQSHQNKASFILNSLLGAMQTLDINAYNLATRLERIRQLAAQRNWQIYFHNKGIEKFDWSGAKGSNYDESLLAIFQLNIRNLRDHKVYLQRQVDDLNGLQEKWRLYLDKRRSLSSEHLNTLMSLLIVLLAGSGASYTIGKVGIDITNQILLWAVIIIAVLPISWHFFSWLTKLLCCMCHGTRGYKWFACKKLTKWLQSIKFFQLFKR